MSDENLEDWQTQEDDWDYEEWKLLEAKDGEYKWTNISVNAIDDDGSFCYIGDEESKNIVDCRFISPWGELAEVILLFYNEQNHQRYCPNCETQILPNRPILLMSNDQYLYPCKRCETMAWWPINSINNVQRYYP